MMIYSNYTYSGTSYVRDLHGLDDLNGLLIPSEFALHLHSYRQLRATANRADRYRRLVTFMCARASIDIFHALEAARKKMAIIHARPLHVEA